ncbi:choice-of-anchor Q domain-containing protein [Spirosoma endbachense]|uniref:Right handed beta helix domain-containing protein n=1 Tax=Spirosoma endbachense TaxID=2666025 RepID=A0A6P1W893_9BACT|nr:choice-of-anchor Q domain-containing protein [Spirosoma endbachense]QHW00240.1 hypothetical protein GJR95_36770 [Spirosoma endbachense]
MKFHITHRLLGLCVLLTVNLIDPPLLAQTIRYVKPTASGSANGSSWANASASLQAIINASASGDQVWVAGGTYKPTSTTDRTVSFAMKNGVAIYGGFAGTETALSQRPPINPVGGPGVVSQPSTTTLSGDIDNDGTWANNSYHVISNPASLSLTPTALLDGVVVSGGNANGTASNNRGGGIHNDGSGNTCQPTFQNCTFQTNVATYGGALFNYGSLGSSSPLLTNCALFSNSAAYGGAMYNYGDRGSSSPQLTNCVFQSNSATSGGALFNFGLYNGSSSPQLTNCVFQSNSATTGGAIGNDAENNGSSSPQLTNCVFQSNSATAGGAMENYGTSTGISNPQLTNCVFQSNSATSGGGAIYNVNRQGTSSSQLTNCSFQSNSANNGGAMYNESNYGTTNPQLTNCSFQSNSATTSGGAMYNYGANSGSSSPLLTNSVLWNNGGSNSIVNFYGALVARYSLFDNTVTGYSGSDNLTTTVSPFVSATSVALYACSPAINAGNPTSVTTSSPPYSETALPATDLMGGPRIVGGRVDMGAVEFTGIVSPVLYVTPAGNGLRNGSSWANAYVGAALQIAIDQAPGCQAQVWVAGGTYKPTSITTDRSVSFTMRNGVGIYGGFAGTETALSQRPPINPVAEPGMVGQPSSTTLSGDIDNDGTRTNNSYHVISNPASLSLTPTALLDGVVISGGNANGSSPHDSGGGGVYNGGSGSGNTCQPSFRNCTFQTNSASFGGAVYNDGSLSGSSSPLLTNCALVSNSATTGGAMYNDGSFSGSSNLVLTNCSFQSNSATSGGAMVNNGERGSSSPGLTNCSLQGNSATNGGGAMVNYGDRGSSSPLLTNSVLWNNGGSSAIVNFSGSMVVARYSLFDASVTGYTSVTGNLTTTTTPFASTATTRLRTGSPAINTADPSTTTATVGRTDLAGLPRVVGRLDMGPLEFQDELFTVKPGPWNDPTVWNVNRLPQPGDRARLKHAITIPGSYPAFVTLLLYDQAGRLLYNAGGRLQLVQ